MIRWRTCNRCGTSLESDDRFCTECGQPRPGQTYADSGYVGVAVERAETLLDPVLTAYELLRRMISGRSPFSDWRPEPGRMPEDLECDIEFAVQSYQLTVFLAATDRRYGRAVSERIEANLLYLSGFDATTGSRLSSLFEAFLAAAAIHDPNSDPLGIGDPKVQFHMTLACAVMRVLGWPEERQSALLMLLAECLNRGLIAAQGPFKRELDATGGIAETPGWSQAPGPFERQLERQHGNPLFPAKARVVSPDQVVDARREDLRHAFKFLQPYRALVREGESFRGKLLPVKDVATYLQTARDLLENCSVLGTYFSPEEKVLEAVSEAAHRMILQATKEPRTQDLHEECRALSEVRVLFQKISITLPPGADEADYLRSILSEDFETISTFGALCGALGHANSLDLARNLLDHAVRDGMDPDVARKKLDAFVRAGMQSTAT